MLDKDETNALFRKWRCVMESRSALLIYRARPKPGNQYYCTFWLKQNANIVYVRRPEQWDKFDVLVVDYIINTLKINDIQISSK